MAEQETYSAPNINRLAIFATASFFFTIDRSPVRSLGNPVLLKMGRGH